MDDEIEEQDTEYFSESYSKRSLKTGRYVFDSRKYEGRWLVEMFITIVKELGIEDVNAIEDGMNFIRRFVRTVKYRRRLRHTKSPPRYQ